MTDSPPPLYHDMIGESNAVKSESKSRGDSDKLEFLLSCQSCNITKKMMLNFLKKIKMFE